MWAAVNRRTRLVGVTHLAAPRCCCFKAIMKIFWLLSACFQKKQSSISRNTLEVVCSAAAAAPSALCYPAKGCLVPNCMWRSKDNHMTLQSDSTSLIRNTCLPRFSSSLLTGAFLDPRLHKADQHPRLHGQGSVGQAASLVQKTHWFPFLVFLKRK